MTTRPSTSTSTALLTGLLVGPLALGLAACGGGTDSSATPRESLDAGAAESTTGSTTSAPPADAQSPESEKPGTNGAAPGDTKTLLAAAATGLQSVPDSTLVSIDRNLSTWEVHVVTADGTEHEMDVAADGDTVTRGPLVDTDDADDTGDLAEQSALVETANLDYRAAVREALAAVPNGTLSELDLDFDDGVAVWDAQVLEDQMTERTVRIDAVSGDVLSNQYDD